jgi:glycosyltransferase involved in cell wall biosynthesis
MVRILRVLVEAGHDAELLLVGGDAAEPDFTKSLHEAIADPLVAGRVHLAGYRIDAMELLPASDVFLCTSVVEEAPIAPLEALAREIPVISTDVGNMADLMPPDRIFMIGDVAGMAGAAAQLLASPALRALEGTAGRRRVREKLSPDVILPRIEAIYRAAIARARDRGRKVRDTQRHLHTTPAE